MLIYPSERNAVSADGGFVMKGHASPAAFRTELLALYRLNARGAPVPELIGDYGGLLVTRQVKGPTLDQFIKTIQPGQIQPVCRSLAAWFSAYYAACPPGQIKGDVSLSNFIVTPDLQIIGLDFEEEAYGSKEDDLNGIIGQIKNQNFIKFFSTYFRQPPCKFTQKQLK